MLHRSAAYEKGLGNVLSRSPWGSGCSIPALCGGQGKPRGLRARNLHRTFQGSSNTSGFLGPQQISIPVSKRLKNPPTYSHNLGRSLLPVKAIWFQLRLPGQHKGKLRPSADPSLFFQRLPQPTALAFASQNFLLLDKHGTNVFRKEMCRLSEDWKSSSKDSDC